MCGGGATYRPVRVAVPLGLLQAHVAEFLKAQVEAVPHGAVGG